ncbi:MAG: hypothetical protein C3F14_05190 [Deltaproteobacteria bacterium]|nr:MAG: hypothetical protein C3F14_05190 [Deltaproteobacteria bacterium]
MRTGRVKRLFLYAAVLILLLGVALVLFERRGPVFDSNFPPHRTCVTDFLARRLVAEKPVPAGPHGTEWESTTLIYVLGGNQESLTARFRKAASLYHEGLARRILILERPGITEYSPELGRNLTNDEWAVRELERLKVRKKDVEAVSVRPSLFGTWSEARDVIGFAGRNGCKRLILVSSTHHTKRVLGTFSRFTRNASPELYVYGAEDSAGPGVLLKEYIKLVLYDIVP